MTGGTGSTCGTDDLGPVLVAKARAEITEALGGTVVEPPVSSAQVLERLAAPGATFVTLTERGRLRGCIGSLTAHRTLADDVRANARAAAFRDPRFVPVDAAELPEIRVEVSVLSAPEPLPASSRAEVERLLRPHVHGVILESGRARGTFLPQVWEQLPEPATFLDHLLRKAGLDGWDDDIAVSTYTVTAWHEVSPCGAVEPVAAEPGLP